MIRVIALAICALLPLSAAVAEEKEQGTSPRPERIVPPEQKPMIPQQKAAAPEKPRASIEQLPVGDGRARLTVRVIVAQEGQGGRDPRLEGVDLNLGTLPLKFGTYKLLEQRNFELDWKQEAQVDLPGSRSLVVVPREMGSDGRVRLHLTMGGAHPRHATKMETDYTIGRGGTLLVGGYRLDPQRPEAGVLLIAITQR